MVEDVVEAEAAVDAVPEAVVEKEVAWGVVQAAGLQRQARRALFLRRRRRHRLGVGKLDAFDGTHALERRRERRLALAQQRAQRLHAPGQEGKGEVGGGKRALREARAGHRGRVTTAARRYGGRSGGEGGGGAP